MREEILKGHTRRIKTGCGNLYITINEEKGDPKEVFIRLGKAGGCAASQSEALGRLITLALRAGVSMDKLVKQLAGIGCHQPLGFGEGKVLSCADAVARCLSRGLKKREEPKEEPISETPKPKKEPIPKAIAAPLEKQEEPVFNHENNYLEVARIVKETPAFSMEPCPDCGSPLTMEEGCTKCHFCGFTRC